MKILTQKYYWMAVHGDVACFDLIESTRRYLIRRTERVNHKPWDELKRSGWRIAKVRIVPFEGNCATPPSGAARGTVR
jgi:hypothetical protein